MKQITLAAYNKLHKDYRGTWTTERWQDADWKSVRHQYMGKRTMLHWIDGQGTCLLVEGMHFEIVG